MLRMFTAGIALAGLGVSGAAFAADLPAPAPAPSYATAPAVATPFTWSGFYAGVAAGYNWGEADSRGPGGARWSTSPDGVVAGGFAGFNYQFGQVVAGLEGDVFWNGASDSRTVVALGSRLTDERSVDGSLRGRIGFAFDRFMPYVTGGLAVANHELRGTGLGKDDTTRLGWTVGGGVEAAVTDNVLARVEYRYSDYGSDNLSLGGTRVRSDLTDSRVTVGVAYKFGL